METGEIDWGADEPNNIEIDVDFSAANLGITVESSGLAGGVAKNAEALTVLDSPVHFEQFLDELFEVKIIQVDSFIYI